MKRGSKKLALVALAAALVPAGVVAHVRLISSSSGKALRWNTPSNVGIVINSAGSDDISDGTDEIALRMAIDEWNGATGTIVKLVEDTDPAQQARTDWIATDVHLMLFDESNASGFFPSGSGTVAITPVLFNSSTGKILDADVLFNGSGFNFTANGQAGRFDVRDVGTHELGHLLGLDHSGAAGSTMYPYVDPTIILHRSISGDEVRGMRDAYPSGSFGSISGTIQRLSDDTPVVGGFVVARDADGRTVTSILTDSTGNFTLVGLEPGSYTVYVRPLDEPVGSSNLGQGFTIQTDFEPGVFASLATIAATETVDLGILKVGADVALNLGTSSDLFPLRVVDGATTTVLVRGTALAAGSTITASDPDFSLGTATWLGTSVTVPITVPDGEIPGNVDLTVTNVAGEISILPAALEVTPPSPTVTMVSPSVGSVSGGTPLTITGTEFHPGARVVIGDHIYTDGIGGTSVIDSNTIQLVTLATSAGTYDVVAYDPSGVEGRLLGGFQTASVPAITTVFPPAGNAAGGTSVTLTGQEFQPGITVRINGVDQAGITLQGSNKLTFTTVLGTPGGPYLLEVENTDGGIATSLFSFANQSDPAVTLVSPAHGTIQGGDSITLTGAGFSTSTAVTFGVDPDTGTGGVPAGSVTFVDSTTLTVVTPAHAKGSVAIMVSEASTQQAFVLPGGFAFRAKSAGGGGGCSTRPIAGPDGPPSMRDVLLGSWWLLALLAILRVWSRPRRPRATLAG